MHLDVSQGNIPYRRHLHNRSIRLNNMPIPIKHHFVLIITRRYLKCWGSGDVDVGGKHNDSVCIAGLGGEEGVVARIVRIAEVQEIYRGRDYVTIYGMGGRYRDGAGRGGRVEFYGKGESVGLVGGEGVGYGEGVGEAGGGGCYGS